MLNTSSICLKGTEKFDQAFEMMPHNEAKIRFLCTETGEPTSVYQISTNHGESWLSPRVAKYSKEGKIIPIQTDTKEKLKNASIFYDTFTKPTHVGTDETSSWFVGDISNCNILGDNYNVQGILVSTIFDTNPKYYISFERIICENQFSRLGKNNSSVYIDMNAFLTATTSVEQTEKLYTILSSEVEKRIEEANYVYDKLAKVKLTDKQINNLFEKLTVDTVSKNNEDKYHEQEIRLNRYRKIYDCDDNQNYKGTLFGFVNTCTNIKSREEKDIRKLISNPVLPASVIDNPCDFEYLCRAAILNNIAA